MVVAKLVCIDFLLCCTPCRRSENLGKFTYISCYIVEVVFGFLEYHVGEASHMEAASNGTMRAIKYGWTNIFVLIWTGIGIRYGQKLSTTLKAGAANDGPNHQLRKIQKYIFALVFGAILGSMQKMVLIPRFIGKTLFRNMPVCSMKKFFFGPTTSTYVVILVVQWAICYAQQPGKTTVRSMVTRAASTIGRATFSRASSRRRSSVTPSQIAAFNSVKGGVASNTSVASTSDAPAAA